MTNAHRRLPSDRRNRNGKRQSAGDDYLQPPVLKSTSQQEKRAPTSRHSP
jgi:hypothetical protein